MRVSHRLLLSTAIAAGTAAAPGVSTVAVAQSAAADGQSVEQVVVTGTRLGGDFSAPTPVTSIGSAELANSAVVTVADLVNNVPSFRLTNTPTESQKFFGGGQNQLDLRGLGTVRTLVLLDGNRFTPTNNTATVDTNMIPTGLVDRVDVVTGGASAAYGSDAVAGVVNFVLKKDIEGIQGTIQYSTSQYGDSRNPYLSLAAGTSFAGGKGHVILGIDASKNSGVGTLYSRNWGRSQPGLIAYGSSRPSGTPASAFSENVTYSQQSAGGLIKSGPLKGVAFGPGGTPYNFDYGTPYSNLMVGGSNPGMNPFGNWSIEIPTKRIAGLGRVSYELTPDIQAYLELNYGFDEGDGTDTFQQNSFIISSGNPYIPASVQAAMTADKLSTITVGRVLTETGGLHQHDTHETVGGRVGFVGEVFGDWDWDASYQFGRTYNLAAVTGPTNLANYNAAVDAVMGNNGAPVCAPLASNPNLTAAMAAKVAPNCAPFDVFGQGSPSADSLAYISGTAWGHQTLQQQDLAANLKGAPFSSWAGPINLATGIEYRTESVSNVSDPTSAIVGWSTANGGFYSGKESVTEGYLEFDVPLANDLPLAKSLDLNGAMRETYYSLSGYANTWKIGLTYEPTSELRLRGTRSRDIRAPNLGELFASSGSGIAVASAFNPINGQTGVLNASSSGNTSLVPEKADTTTLGVAYQPEWMPGFTASLDWYSIDVKDVIAAVSATSVLNNCAAGKTQYCSAITFNNSQFGIANIAQEPYNLNGLSTEGLDFELGYTVPLQDLSPSIAGTLSLRALGTYVTSLKTTLPNGGGSTDYAGSLSGGVPSWVWNVNLAYQLNRFSANLNAHFVTGSHYSATNVGPDSSSYSPALSKSIADNRFPPMVYFNLGASYDLVPGADADKPSLQIFGGIDNLVNTQPPAYAAIAITGGNPYDLVGRVFKMGVRFAY